MPEETPELDREHRMRDDKGNFRIFGEARKDHPYNIRDGKRGVYDAKTGKVEYGEKKDAFKFGK